MPWASSTKRLRAKSSNISANELQHLKTLAVFGKALTHGLAGLWRYRVRDYRIVCRIEDNEIRVLVLGIGHRKEIYR